MAYLESDQEQPPVEALLPGPPVPGHRIQHDTRAGTFLIDQTLIPCAPIQYRLLLCLLERVERCAFYAHLMACMDGGPPTDAAGFRLAKDRLMHQISGLRAKLWAHGLDIACVMGVGYLPLRTENRPPEEQPEAREEATP